MIAADLLRFMIIYLIFVVGFAQSYYVIYQSYDPTPRPAFDYEIFDNPMPTPVESFLRVFIMSLGIFGDVWYSLEDTRHSFAGKVCCFVFLAIAYILLVNLLIA